MKKTSAVKTSHAYVRFNIIELGCVDDLTTELSLDSWVIDVLGFYMLSMGVCTTRHWQKSGRLVQEFNVCMWEYDLVLFKKKL